MKCNYCGQNEADHGFVINIMGRAAELYLCSGCLAGLQKHIAFMMRYAAEEETASTYPNSHTVQVRELGKDPFPLDAGEDIKRRRVLKELKTRLREAVEREDYELAAQLRDEILRKEEGVLIYDT
jgi:protein-arginine kinase activator protein McsA